jgi:hypothetical protein
MDWDCFITFMSLKITLSKKKKENNLKIVLSSTMRCKDDFFQDFLLRTMFVFLKNC